jgi:hypothetical protein
MQHLQISVSFGFYFCRAASGRAAFSFCLLGISFKKPGGGFPCRARVSAALAMQDLFANVALAVWQKEKVPHRTEAANRVHS